MEHSEIHFAASDGLLDSSGAFAMAFFKRSNKKNTKKKVDSSATSKSRAESEASEGDSSSRSPRESSPQRVGIVSGILTTSATVEGESGLSEIVDRHFGPDIHPDTDPDTKGRPAKTKGDLDDLPHLPPQREHLHAVEPLLEEELNSPKLEIDPMAHVGHATTITGNIVAEEDLEIHGTVEGAIRLANHQLTVGSDGLVKASVEAHTVLVNGRISGDVVASELVEIRAGGIIGGDVKSPRVIMHDGGIVVGGLDMSASLPSSAESSKAPPPTPDLPRLIRVELPDDSSMDEGNA